MDRIPLSLTMMYCAVLSSPAAVCSSWMVSVGYVMLQIWKDFWLGDFIMSVIPVGITQASFETRLQRLMSFSRGELQYWYDLQLSLSLFCRTHRTSPLKVAMDQCVFRNMDYDFMRCLLRSCVDNRPLKTFHFGLKRLVRTRVLACDHVGRTVLEVVDTLVCMRENRKPMCRCDRGRCGYGNPHQWMPKWLQRCVARARKHRMDRSDASIPDTSTGENEDHDL